MPPMPFAHSRVRTGRGVIGIYDAVAVAMQYEGPASARVPLIASHRRDAPLQLFEGPSDVLRTMNQYCGSVAFDANGRVLGVSSPRGNVVTAWDAANGAHLSSVTVPDGSGIAPGTQPGTFLASSGQGGVVLIDGWRGTATPMASDFLEARRWDNHMMVSLSGGPA